MQLLQNSRRSTRAERQIEEIERIQERVEIANRTLERLRELAKEMAGRTGIEVLAALVRTLASSAALDSVDALSTRAMLAAESGMDVALNRAYAPRGTPSCSTRNWTFDAAGLRGCSVTVTCALAPRSEPRTAQPSIAELSCAGTLMGEMMSAARIRPSASRTASCSTPAIGWTNWRITSLTLATGRAFGS